MTVKELIEKLSGSPMDTQVVIEDAAGDFVLVMNVSTFDASYWEYNKDEDEASIFHLAEDITLIH